MRVAAKSQWDEKQIVGFLKTEEIPIRLAFLDRDGSPRICSLWYQYADGVIWLASHKSSFLVSQLKESGVVSFEVSTNDYPYKGVRGKAAVELLQKGAAGVLDDLIAKYLKDGNTPLAAWLKSRARDEFAIKLTPSTVNAWDFSHRMEA